MEYKKRVVTKKALDYQRKHRGLGSIIRQAAGIERGGSKQGKGGEVEQGSGGLEDYSDKGARILTPLEVCVYNSFGGMDMTYMICVCLCLIYLNSTFEVYIVCA